MGSPHRAPFLAIWIVANFSGLIKVVAVRESAGGSLRCLGFIACGVRRGRFVPRTREVRMG